MAVPVYNTLPYASQLAEAEREVAHSLSPGTDAGKNAL